MSAPEPTRSGVERRLHPMYLVFAFFGTLKDFALPLVFLLVLRRGDFDTIALFFVVPSVVVAILRYVSLRYVLGEHEIRIRGGLLFRFDRHIPYQRIQNLKLNRGLFHRLFGLTGLTIETASGEEVEAKLDVLSIRDLRFIEQKLGHLESQADLADESFEDAADGSEGASSERLVRLGIVDVLIAGLASNRGLTLILAAVGFTWEQVGNDGIRSWYEYGRSTLERLGFSTHSVTGLGLAFALPLLALFIYMASRVVSMIWSILKFSRFQLRLDGTDLRLRQGLFTETASTIPRDRIQTITLSRGPLLRFIGRLELNFATAGGASGDDAALRRIPSVEILRLPHLLEMIQPESLAPIVRSSAALRRCWRVLFLRYALVAAAGLGAIRYFLDASVLITGVLGIVFLLAVFVLARRRIEVLAIGISDQDVIVTRGWPTFEAQRLSYAKLQSIALSESLFDRRRGTASLSLDHAGAGFGRSGVRVDFIARSDAFALAEIIGKRAAQARFVWN